MKRLELAPPPDRGPLLCPAQVAALIGGVKEAWVRRTVPHKVHLGRRTVRWYERDVQAWLETRRDYKPGKRVKQCRMHR